MIRGEGPVYTQCRVKLQSWLYSMLTCMFYEHVIDLSKYTFCIYLHFGKTQSHG